MEGSSGAARRIAFTVHGVALEAHLVRRNVSGWEVRDWEAAKSEHADQLHYHVVDFSEAYPTVKTLTTTQVELDMRRCGMMSAQGAWQRSDDGILDDPEGMCVEAREATRGEMTESQRAVWRAEDAEAKNWSLYNNPFGEADAITKQQMLRDYYQHWPGDCAGGSHCRSEQCERGGEHEKVQRSGIRAKVHVIEAAPVCQCGIGLACPIHPLMPAGADAESSGRRRHTQYLLPSLSTRGELPPVPGSAQPSQYAASQSFSGTRHPCDL